MSDGTEQVAGAPQDSAASQPVDLQTQETSQETTEQQSVDDGEEIEFDGEKYRVPKKLKDGFLMQSDYTRKTQEVAEQRKGLEGERAAFDQATKAHQAQLQDVGRVMMLNERIAELEKLDWQALESKDFFEAQTKFREYTLAKSQRDGLINQIQANEQRRSQEAQQDFAKRYQAANERLAKDITGWNQELADNLRNFAIANGASNEDIRALALNVPLVKLLHKAYLGDQIVAAKQTAAKEAAQQPEVKPLTKVSGAGTKSQSINPQTGPDNMDDFVKWTRRKKA